MNRLEGKTVLIRSGKYKGKEYEVEGLWNKISGMGWAKAPGNPACLEYSIRRKEDNLPGDEMVLYGKINGFGKLIHVSEIDMY